MGFLPSETITNTYFINENSNLPVISLSTDPTNLWDYNEGIYVSWSQCRISISLISMQIFGRIGEKQATFQLFDENKIYQVTSQ